MFIEENNLNPEEVHLELNDTDLPSPGVHPGRLYLPTASEVYLLLCVHMSINSQWSIVCFERQSLSASNLCFFQDYHRYDMPLMHPLLFPHGTDGWALDARSITPPYNKVFLAPYFRFHLCLCQDQQIVIYSTMPTSFISRCWLMYGEWRDNENCIDEEQPTDD